MKSFTRAIFVVAMGLFTSCGQDENSVALEHTQLPGTEVVGLREHYFSQVVDYQVRDDGKIVYLAETSTGRTDVYIREVVLDQKGTRKSLVAELNPRDTVIAAISNVVGNKLVLVKEKRVEAVFGEVEFLMLDLDTGATKTQANWGHATMKEPVYDAQGKILREDTSKRVALALQPRFVNAEEVESVAAILGTDDSMYTAIHNGFSLNFAGFSPKGESKFQTLVIPHVDGVAPPPPRVVRAGTQFHLATTLKQSQRAAFNAVHARHPVDFSEKVRPIIVTLSERGAVINTFAVNAAGQECGVTALASTVETLVAGGACVAQGRAKGFVAKIDLKTGEQRVADLDLSASFESVGSVAIQPDGKVLASGTFDFWQVQTMSVIRPMKGFVAVFDSQLKKWSVAKYTGRRSTRAKELRQAKGSVYISASFEGPITHDEDKSQKAGIFLLPESLNFE